MSHKSWVFTINNYTDDDVNQVKALPCQRMTCGYEVGKSGTPHLQGAVTFKQTHRKGVVCKLLGGRAWVKKMGGTWEDQEYTVKEGRVCRLFECSQQGNRTDLEQFRDAIKRKCDDEELFEKHLECVAKYPRLESRLRRYYAGKQSGHFRQLEVVVLWGKAGTGKTRAAFEDGAFLVPKSENYKWWNGYEGQRTICLNDFYGDMKWTKFLDILDGYPMQVEVKGDMVHAEWTKVYITSNVHPSQWYVRGRVGDTTEMTHELARRLSKIEEFK